MGMPRSRYVQEGEEGVYHCYSRCVRRASLCGFDPLTRRDFSHRKAWLVDRLRYLAGIFAIDVCAFAALVTHYHTILRTRPDIVEGWSDREIAARWLMLFPRHRSRRSVMVPPLEEQIRALADCPNRIAQLRKRLCSLSWFMGQLNEFIARKANKEDGVKGRFWEGRFKCQALLDEAAIAACMVYVDLNPIRAGLAQTPEQSDFTSIQERIHAWQNETMTDTSTPTQTMAINPRSDSADNGAQSPDSSAVDSYPFSKPPHEVTHSVDRTTSSADWLCPIQSDSHRRGILKMTATEYFNLVDLSGRVMRSDKWGAININLAPILLRIGAKPAAWLETVSHFGSRFCLAAGRLSNLRKYADRIGRRWLKGIAATSSAFELSPPQMA